MPWPRPDFGACAALIADLLWPTSCLGCGTARVRGLCGVCQALVQPHQSPRCRRCDDASPQRLCRRCLGAGPSVWQRARAPVVYAGPIKDMIRRGKHAGHEHVFAHAAQSLLQDAEVRALAQGCAAITYVPLAPARRWTRGYNPAAILARHLGGALGLPVLRLLRHRGGLRPQSLLQGPERAAAAHARFAPAFCPWGRPLGQVLVVDDVITTGATLHAVAQVLARLGVRRMHAVAWARHVRMHGHHAPDGL
jgi:predicted amidophosphoribosyltransferase